jgi:hypothetical protein
MSLSFIQSLTIHLYIAQELHAFYTRLYGVLPLLSRIAPGYAISIYKVNYSVLASDNLAKEPPTCDWCNVELLVLVVD